MWKLYLLSWGVRLATTYLGLSLGVGHKWQKSVATWDNIELQKACSMAEKLYLQGREDYSD